jgi:hypothetical protein
VESTHRAPDGGLDRLNGAGGQLAGPLCIPRSALYPVIGWWHDGGVPMREECKHFQSRTYASGEVARFCLLDLAPEAPWRCPDDCPSYERRLADAGWVHGSLVEPPIEDEPEDGANAASMLDDAEEIVNRIAPEAVAEARAEDAKREGRKGWWRRRGR